MVNACTVNPPIFPRTDIPKLTVAGSPGFGNVSGEVSPALSTACTGNGFSKRTAGGAPGFGKISPLVSLLDSLFAGKGDSRNARREEPPVSRRSSPVFPFLFRFQRKPGSQNHQRKDRDFATIWTVFPAAEDCATASARGENRGSPRRPRSSH